MCGGGVWGSVALHSVVWRWGLCGAPLCCVGVGSVWRSSLLCGGGVCGAPLCCVEVGSVWRSSLLCVGSVLLLYSLYIPFLIPELKTEEKDGSQKDRKRIRLRSHPFPILSRFSSPYIRTNTHTHTLYIYIDIYIYVSEKKLKCF